LQILFRPFYHGTLPEIYLKILAFSSSMQRRTVPMNGPAQGDLGEVHEVVNLLQTDVRAEYQKPPLHSGMHRSVRARPSTPCAVRWLRAAAARGSFERIKSPGAKCCACDISGLSAARRCRRRSIWHPTTS